MQNDDLKTRTSTACSRIGQPESHSWLMQACWRWDFSFLLVISVCLSICHQYDWICVFLQEIANVHAHYERIKQALPVSASVRVTPVNLTAQLQECALDFQKWSEALKVSVWSLAAHPWSSDVWVDVTAKCWSLFDCCVSCILKQKEKNPAGKESPQPSEVRLAMLAFSNLYVRMVKLIRLVFVLSFFVLQCSKRADLLASIKSKSYGDLATVCPILIITSVCLC